MTSVQGGTIVWNLDLDDSKFKAGLASAKGQANSLGRSIDSDTKRGTDAVGTSFAGMAAKAVGAIAAIGAALGAVEIGKTLINTASELQSTRASFESMLGSAEAASSTLQDLNKFSFETAFSTEAINAAAKGLLGAGLPAERLLETMRDIGDVAGATGADLGQLTLPLSQAFARGKLQGQDFLQILNSGAGKLGQTIRQEVAERGLGDFEEAMQKGLITSDILFTSIGKAADEGGFAFQGAIKQADTFNGRMSNLIENLTGVGLKILGVNKATGEVQEGGLFDRLSDSVKAVSDFLTSIGTKINEFKTVHAAEIKFFGDLAKRVFDALKVAVEFVSTQLRDQLIPLWNENKEEIKALAIVVGVVLLAALAAAVIGIAVVIGAIALLVAAVRFVNNAVRAFVDFNVFAFNFLKDQAIATFNNMVNGVRNAYNAIVNIVSSFFRVGVDIVNGIINGIRTASGAVLSTLLGIATGAINAVKRLLGISSPSKVFASIGGDMMAGLTKGIVSSTQKAVNAASSAAAAVTDSFTNPSIETSLAAPTGLNSGFTGTNVNPVTVQVTQNNSGIVAQSRAAWREINKDGIEAINEELRAKGMPEIGGGTLTAGSSTV